MNDKEINDKEIAEKLHDLAYILRYYGPVSDIPANLDKLANKLDPPKPKFANIKVGDWVLLDTGNQCPVIRVYTDNQGFAVKHRGVECYFNLMGNSIYSDEYRVLRKLSGYEVKIKVTLEGTIMRSSSEADTFLIFDNNGMASEIRFDSLDPSTRKLVESLLKAQEEE